LITNEDIRRFLTEHQGVPTVNLSRFRCDPDAVNPDLKQVQESCL